MNETTAMFDNNNRRRCVQLGALFGAVALVAGCVSEPAPIVTRTTTERTTTQQVSPYSYSSPDTSVTTTRTQQYLP
jgi:PBP1b-binding outer membrane lipoprotein LpoB